MKFLDGLNIVDASLSFLKKHWWIILLVTNGTWAIERFVVQKTVVETPVETVIATPPQSKEVIVKVLPHTHEDLEKQITACQGKVNYHVGDYKGTH